MNSDNIILIGLIVFIVTLILLDVFLNKRSVLKEDFQTIDYNKGMKNMYGEKKEIVDNISDTTHIQSIVSKYTGKVINVEAINEPPSRLLTVPFFDENSRKKSLSVNEDGTYSLVIPNKTSVNQQFILIFVDCADTYAKHIPLKNENLGYNIEDASYPFYILKSHKDMTKALQYQDGNIMIRPLANYDGQKWDISYDKIEKVIGTHKRNFESKLSGDYRANPDELGSNEYGDLDKIKIKLNLDNNVINKFINQTVGTALRDSLDSDAESSYDDDEGRILSGKSCPLDLSYNDRVPNNAIKSLCPGCNPNNL